MKKPTDFIKATLLPAVVAFAFTATAGEKSAPAEPDFALPQSVVAEANSLLQQSLQKRDYTEAIRSVIDMTIASNLISKDNASAMATRADSLAKEVPAPYSALAYLLEGSLYKSIYNDEKWVYDSRTLPADFNNPDPTTWSKTVFEKKITSLVDLALDNMQGADKIPLQDLGLIITTSPEALAPLLTLSDFIYNNACVLLREFSTDNKPAIPFFRHTGVNTGNKADLLLDKMEQGRFSTDSYGLALAVCMKARQMNDSALKEQYLFSMYEKMKDSPASLPILLAIFDNSTDSKLLYKTLTEARSQFPDSPYSSDIANAIAAITAPGVVVTVPSVCEPGKTLTLEMTACNVKDFYIHVYRLKKEDYGVPASKLPAIGTLFSTIHIRTDMADMPAEEQLLHALSIDKPGYYAIAASFSDHLSKSSKFSEGYAAVVNVTDITLSTLGDDATGKSGVYVRTASTGAPMSHTAVEFIKSGYRNQAVKTLYTDNEGYAISPWQSSKAIAKHNGSKATANAGSYKRGNERARDLTQILCDRGIYHPSDTVRFVAVAYRQNAGPGKSGRLLPDHRLTMILRDANYNGVDTVTAITDALGRVSGAFRLPADGLRGTWTIHTSGGQGTAFQVADYKAPRFQIILKKDTTDAEYASFSGKTVTYSGMPLADITVDYTIDFNPWWWRMSRLRPASYSASTVSDSAGNFTIQLPLDNIKDTEWCNGIYTLTASATDATGDHAESSPVKFMLAESFVIHTDIAPKTEVTNQSLTLPVKVTDPLGYPVKRTVEYTMTDTSGKTVASGDFLSPTLKTDARNIPSGRYNIRFRLKDGEEADTASVSTVIWRKDDKIPPVATPLWVPQTEITVSPDTRDVALTVGTSFPECPILCIISSEKGIISRNWIKKTDAGNFTVTLPSPADNGKIWADLSVIHNLASEQQRITLTPSSLQRRLEIHTESFRPSVAPGTRESWKFRFTADGDPMSNIPAMAVMTDKALDAFAPFTWNLQLPLNGIYCPTGIFTQGAGQNRNRIYGNSKGKRTTPAISLAWQTYNRALYGALRIRGLGYTRSAAASSGSIVTGVVDEAYDNGLAMASMKMMEHAASAPVMKEESVTDADEAAIPNDDTSSISLHPSELPLAFFMPSLTTDSNGVASVEFEVPDFNTEWKFQIAGYTPSLLTASETLTAVASRPVMASLQTPAFMLTGDKVILAGALYNNTADTADIASVIEIADPVTGKVLKKISFSPAAVAASGRRTVTAEFECPDSLSSLAIRLYAISEKGRDGEQILIPVLPSSQPVIESTTFYLSPSTSEYTFRADNRKEGAKTTFRYCDNPVWTVLTSLPALSDDRGVSLHSRLARFFADATASSLLERNPSLRKGMQMIVNGEAGDSALVSALDRYPDLRTVSLDNTPWVNTAKAETLRLQSLATLLDGKKAKAAIKDSWQSILRLRGHDGGWSWCPDMPSSLWMTEHVLSYLGKLNAAGNMPDIEGIERVCTETVRYCDQKEVEEYNRRRKYTRDIDYSTLLDYLHTRTYFTSAQSSAAFTSLREKALNDIAADWKNMSISDKAKAAVVMMCYGRSVTASAIIESLRQYASTAEAKGMWYDNLRSGYSGRNDLAATILALKAFNRLDPADPAIDMLRQWLILQYQTRSVAGNAETVEIADAILTTGTPWTETSRKAPQITIDGIPLTPGKTAALTGAVEVDLSADGNSASEIRIQRQAGGGPAWGGVISQYISPAEEVTEAATSELSVSKQYYRIEKKGGKEKAIPVSSFQKGDLIRVTIMVKTMQPMDYVALTDLRPACLTPDIQTSGYDASDGTPLYREVRTTATNLYISHLEKGAHVFSYDCHATSDGIYSAGIATVQCQQDPLQTAHSAGRIITVEDSSTGYTD